MFLAELIFGIGAYRAGGIALNDAPIHQTAVGVSNIEAIGALLYTRYIFLFETAGIILLVAMIGAIVLTHRKRGGVRPQDVSRQVTRRPEDAIRNTQPEIGKGVEL